MMVRRLIASILLLASGSCGPRADLEPFTVGQLVPLTGPKQGLGEHARNGAGLAVEVAFRGDRRVLGRTVVVRHVDDRGETELVQAEAVRLLTLNRAIALVGGPEPAANVQLARAVAAYGVPVVLPADLATAPVGESVFCVNAAPEARGAALAHFAARELHCRQVIVLTDDGDAVGKSLAAGFAKRWQQEHSVDDKSSIQMRSDKDKAKLPEVLTGLAEVAKPDAVLLAVPPDELLPLWTRLAKAGLKKPILYAGEDVGTEAFAGISGPGPDVYLATAFTDKGNLGPDGEAFVREYEEKYHQRPDLVAALAYDSVRLLVDAVERAKSVQPARLSAALAATSGFPGLTGPLSMADRRARRPLFLVSLKEGETKVVATLGPDLE